MEIDKLKKLDSELKENHLIKTLNDLKTEYDDLNIEIRNFIINKKYKLYDKSILKLKKISQDNILFDDPILQNKYDKMLKKEEDNILYTSIPLLEEMLNERKLKFSDMISKRKCKLKYYVKKFFIKLGRKIWEKIYLLF